MRRVHWMELFFDLVFVVFIGQLAHGLHGEPGPWQFAGFLFILAIGWWAWINMTVTINILPNLPVRRLSTVMLLGMFAAGAIAVAAPEATGDRAWLFALGCAALRLVLLPLWIFRARRHHIAMWPSFVYNGVTAAIWIVSAFVPQPLQFGLWILAVAVEVALATFGRINNAPLADELDVPHIAERLGLFVIIVMGESVFSVIETLSHHFELNSGIVALLGMLLIATLAWTYFLYSAPTFEQGLDQLLKARDTIAMRDVAMFFPFVLVAGVTTLAAGLAMAVEHPTEPLAPGNLVSLFGGLAAFYLTVGLVGVRMGRATRRIVPWLVVGGALPLAALAVSLVVPYPAAAAVAVAAVIVAGMTVYSEAESRRQAREAAAAA